MAAGQVVCPFLDVVFKKLEDLIKTDLGQLWGVKEELKKLYSTFCVIKHVLSDAEERQFKEGEELIRLGLQKLNDASYKADDVLDEFAFKALQLASVGISRAPQATNFRRKVQKDIKKLIKSFHAIAKEASKLDLRRGNIKTTAEEICPDRESISISYEPHVYGRDKDKEKLVKQLLGDYYMTLEQFHLLYKHPRALGQQQTPSNSKEDVSICSILGIGGLGKTTLAQLVYNDVRITKHFEVESWICLSNGFDVKRIIKAIIACFLEKAHDSEMGCHSDDLESLRSRLQKELSGGKRFLLVLDDVWDVSPQEWKKLKEVLLKCGAKGSSIIITTRLQKTAYITSTHPHHLKGLSEIYCLDLFEQYAFDTAKEKIPALVEIGKEIVKKCGGLPLAAKAMGGMLHFKTEESEWNEVKESEVWELVQSSENNILPSLRLSYYHLPPPLKRCFVYCSIFPKDYLIEKQQLIQLWIANGLVQSRAKMELEDVGNEIFNGLLQRSFFQDEKENEVGDIISCKMHDLVHDLAIYIAGYECVGKDDGSTRDITERTRHVSIMSNGELPPSSILGSIERSSSCLRSLLLLNDKNVALVSKLALSKFICLRALDLHSSGIKVLSDSIGEMIHLRYLNLSHNWEIVSIPESICSLTNLQTLNLHSCEKLESLPKNMRKMSSLRHLDVQGCIRLQSMPIGMGKLTCLCTLSKFIVGKESGNGLDELQGLNNLRGELEIRGLAMVKNPREAKVANLMNKKHLHSLGLIEGLQPHETSESEQDQQGNKIQEEVIEGLQPHENLRKLKVEGYGGVSCSPSWLTAVGVPNLVEITLEYCTRYEHLSPLGKLRYLKVLNLYEMKSLKFIDVDDDVDANVGGGGGFPSLEEIDFSYMHDLEGWSSSLSLSSQATQVAVFPRLKKVSLRECPKLTGGIPLACSPVQSVDMFACNGMFLGSLRDLPSLPYLEINCFDEMEYFPPGALRNLTALETLEISGCHILKALPVELKSLAKLTTLEIAHCNALERLPELEKTSLVNLRIEECREMEFLKEDFEQLVALETLTLSVLPKLTCFPEGGLKNLSSLRTLVIEYCNALERLPELEKTSLVNLRIEGGHEMEFLKEDFEQLVTLETLTLSDLPKLTCFPEGIKDSAGTLKRLEIGGYWEDNDAMDLPDWVGTCLTSLEYLEINAPTNWKVLPQWMQHLAALKTLWVYGCNKELKKRWKMWKGSEEDDEEDEEYDEDDEKDEEYDEDNEEDEDKEREDDCFNMISHVPDVKLFSCKYVLMSIWKFMFQRTGKCCHNGCNTSLLLRH